MPESASGGMSAPGGLVSAPGGCLLLGVSAPGGGGLWCLLWGSLLRGVSALGGVVSALGVSAQGVVSQHALGVWGVSVSGGRGWYPSMH